MSSTFDAFFKIANQPEVKSLLPVVTAEIEDGKCDIDDSSTSVFFWFARGH